MSGGFGCFLYTRGEDLISSHEDVYHIPGSSNFSCIKNSQGWQTFGRHSEYTSVCRFHGSRAPSLVRPDCPASRPVPKRGRVAETAGWPKRGPGRAQMPMGNLSECKQAMLEYEMDTLTLGMGRGMDGMNS